MNARLLLITFFGTVALTGPAHAADAEPASPVAPENRVVPDPELDEVLITARTDSLSSLRQALIDAEDRFYARLNELNEDDALDILCRTEAPTGARLKRRTCAPRLLDDASREQAMLLVAGSGGTGGNLKLKSTGDLRAMAAEELKRRTLPLLDTDPALRQALLERTRLQQMYDDLRRRKLDGKIVVWD